MNINAKEAFSATETIRRGALARGDVRQLDHAERAVALLRGGAEKQGMKENQQFATLDTQYAEMDKVENRARQEGNARGVELAGRAKQTILRLM